MVSWRRARLRVSPRLADFLAERLTLAGWEKLASERLPGEQSCTLSVFAEAGGELPGAERLRAWLAEAATLGLAPPTELAWEEDGVAELDWDAGFRAHFAARELAPGIVIRPSWDGRAEGRLETPPGAGAPIAIVLEPGQAFGTGDHPTTELCLEAMQAWFTARRAAHPGEAPRCLDIGSGTGVLSIAARLWGAGSVRGYDIEPAALVNAYLNAELNGLAGRLDFAWGEPVGLEPAAWDLLLCNLYLGPILRLLPRLDAALAPGAGAILSGFLCKQSAQVRGAAQARGWRLVAERSRDDWAAQVWAKPEPGGA